MGGSEVGPWDTSGSWLVRGWDFHPKQFTRVFCRSLASRPGIQAPASRADPGLFGGSFPNCCGPPFSRASSCVVAC